MDLFHLIKFFKFNLDSFISPTLTNSTKASNSKFKSFNSNNLSKEIIHKKNFEENKTEINEKSNKLTTSFIKKYKILKNQRLLNF